MVKGATHFNQYPFLHKITRSTAQKSIVLEITVPISRYLPARDSATKGDADAEITRPDKGQQASRVAKQRVKAELLGDKGRADEQEGAEAGVGRRHAQVVVEAMLSAHEPIEFDDTVKWSGRDQTQSQA